MRFWMLVLVLVFVAGVGCCADPSQKGPTKVPVLEMGVKSSCADGIDWHALDGITFSRSGRKVFELAGPAAKAWSRFGPFQVGPCLLPQPVQDAMVWGRKVKIYRFTVAVIIEGNGQAYVLTWSKAKKWQKEAGATGLPRGDDLALKRLPPLPSTPTRSTI